MSLPSKPLNRQSAQIHELLDSLNLDSAETHAQNSEFAFKAPQHLLKQIQTRNAQDPILLQVLPTKHEQLLANGYSQDPVGDLHKNPIPSLIHKYHGRVLLIASPKCDVHCRYCFRRHFPYETQSNRHHWQHALEYIAKDSSIHEVILSGGDPMSLSENILLDLCQKIESIAHIKTLRIHSRTPIVSPQTAAQNQWLDWIKHSRLKCVIVVHCNHSQELTTESEQLFAQYRQANIHLLNQSVLLKKVNDAVDTLETLSHKLFAQGVMPYYLHQLDKVAGAAHFQVEDEFAKHLHEQLRQKLPGYLVPKLVQEIAGEPYKSRL